MRGARALGGARGARALGGTRGARACRTFARWILKDNTKRRASALRQQNSLARRQPAVRATEAKNRQLRCLPVYPASPCVSWLSA